MMCCASKLIRVNWVKADVKKYSQIETTPN